MQHQRRQFLRWSVLSLSMATTLASAKTTTNPTPIKLAAFDAFPIFDPRPIFGLVKKLYPEQGKEFSNLWRNRIFEYTWLLASAGKYQDFWSCIDDALLYTAGELKITLSRENHDQLMNAFLNIKAYPDVKQSLDELKNMGVKLAFLSNMTDKMLISGIKNSSLDGYFDHVISTDKAATFKPHPRAYQLGIDTSGFSKEEIVFVAFASWDAIGAKWFGYPTLWVNRLNFGAEQLGLAPDAAGPDLKVVTQFVAERLRNRV